VDWKLVGMGGVSSNRQAWSGALSLIAAVARRSQVRWALVLLSLLILSAATPIDILVLNDPDLGDRATVSPLAGEQVQAMAMRLLSDAAHPCVPLPSLALGITPDVLRGVPNSVPRLLLSRRLWVRVRTNLDRQAARPSSSASDPA
jgi:hypothetical protein